MVYKELTLFTIVFTQTFGNNKSDCFPSEWQPPWPQKCPQLPEGTVGNCFDACGEFGCPAGKLCCSNGCGLVCKTPVFGPFPGDLSPTECPTVPDGEVGSCKDGCSPKCPYPQICCSNGCGSYCWGFPTVPPPTAIFQCPTIEPGTIGDCIELCNFMGYIGYCPPGELCCSNGCGHVCMPPQKVCPDFGPPTVNCLESPCQNVDCPEGTICCDDYSTGCDYHCV